jgi:proteasome accessory factor C
MIMPKSSSLSGADRYNFMLALTGYLINHRQQPLADLAKHFQVSEKEIKSAVVTISLSGVGLYRPDELFFLDYDLLEEDIVDLSFAPTLDAVPRLSTRQAAAIASGLAYLVDLVGPEDQVHINELLEILGKGALSTKELPFMVQPTRGDGDLALVRQAVAESRAISCSYINASGEISNREIEPQLLESRESNWFVRGFCRTKAEPRVFRLDRMRQIELLETFEERPAPKGNASEIYEVRDTDTEVLFEVEPEAFGLIADYKPEFEISGNDAVQVKIAIGELETLGRIVSRYSGKVRVLAPETARQAVREFAQRALGHHKPAPVAE